MELQINQLIEKYQHKAKSHSEGRGKYNPGHDYELVQAVLAAPEHRPKQLVAQLEKQMGVSKVPFHVARQLGRNQLDRPDKRLEWAELVTQAGQDLCQFALESTEPADYKALYEKVKQVVFVEKKTRQIEPKAILFVFCTELPDTVSYKSSLQETARLTNFDESKKLLHDIVDVIATERGFSSGSALGVSDVGGSPVNISSEVSDVGADNAGTQGLIHSLTCDIERTDGEPAQGTAATAADVRIADEKDDLRAAAEVARLQLEALQEELEQVREEAKQEAALTFFQEMNSAKHSNLLDQFLKAELLVKQLRQQGTDIPQEIELIPSLIRMFTRFVKMQGIRPKAVVGERKQITLNESDEYEYIGSEWEDPDEHKTVEVQSAGWLYADTLISKPKVQEVTS